MFTIGSVGWHYRSIYRPTLGRYINRVSTATWPTYRLRLGRVSVKYRSSISRLSVKHRAIYRRRCVPTDTVLVSSTLGRYLNTLPTVCRYLTDTRSICGRPSASRVLVDMSVANCPTLHWCCVDILLLSIDIKKVLSSSIVGGTCGLLEQIIIIMIIITLLPIIRHSDYSRQLPCRRIAGKSFHVKVDFHCRVIFTCVRT